ncbi:hypothetical protein KFE25_007015 [Diacronema lutheri]|uniref:AB hydrolase-1 domain-containing protein n=1 Tax=Diacronema lutheri TaxID=2081491 RepID=A0A8J6CHP4_DIALT|nr:hypothetical protein KFE25_007015 [Diacronema lutheri]
MASFVTHVLERAWLRSRIASSALGFRLLAKGLLLVALHMLVGIYAVCGACWVALSLAAPRRLPARVGPVELARCEEAYVRVAHPPRTRSVWTHLQGCALHSLVLPCSGAPRGALLVLHGTGSSAALLMASCARALSAHFDVHALDLPGYGISTADGLADACAERTIDIICCACEAYCVSHGLGDRLAVVGHSIGGFYALHWASRSSRAARVVLVNPTGLLPMLGASGAYWAELFRLGLPMSCLQAFGSHVALLLWPLLRGCGPRLRYWACLQSSCVQHHLVARFLDVRFARARWALPAAPLAAELAARGRLSLVWSRGDTIVPVEQGRFVAAMLGLANAGAGAGAGATGGRVSLYVEMDGLHGPFHERAGRAISAALFAAIPRGTDDERAGAVHRRTPTPHSPEPGSVRAAAPDAMVARCARAVRAGRIGALLPSCGALSNTWSYFDRDLTRASLAVAYEQLAALAAEGGPCSDCACGGSAASGRLAGAAELRRLGAQAARSKLA